MLKGISKYNLIRQEQKIEFRQGMLHTDKTALKRLSWAVVEVTGTERLDNYGRAR
jgi:hypothetical protein